MRTKNIFRLVDTITWLLISLAPIIYYGCLCLGHNAVQVPNFYEYCTTFGSQFNFSFIGNFIESILSYINVSFGSYISVISWFVLCQITHFIIDVFLWIFRLCHHWLNSAVDKL